MTDYEPSPKGFYKNENSFISNGLHVRCKDCGSCHLFKVDVGANAKKYVKEKFGDVPCEYCESVLDIPDVVVY